MKLDEVKTKHIVFVKKINVEGAYKKRLQEMGLVPGRKIYIQKFAPMGNPMEIKLNGQSISIRNEDAHMIEVGEQNE